MTPNERVREIRKSLCLTLEKFGEKIGMKKNSVSQIESGKNSLTEQTIKSICREFDVSEDWIRYGIGDMFMERIDEDETAALVSNLLGNDNPFYDTILSTMRMYDKLSQNSQRVVDDFFKSIAEDMSNKKES